MRKWHFKEMQFTWDDTVAAAFSAVTLASNKAAFSAISFCNISSLLLLSEDFPCMNHQTYHWITRSNYQNLLICCKKTYTSNKTKWNPHFCSNYATGLHELQYLKSYWWSNTNKTTFRTDASTMNMMVSALDLIKSRLNCYWNHVIKSTKNIKSENQKSIDITPHIPVIYHV